MEEDAREEMDWEEGEVWVPERSSDLRRVEKVRFVSSGGSSKGGESGEGKRRRTSARALSSLFFSVFLPSLERRASSSYTNLSERPSLLVGSSSWSLSAS